MRVCLNCKAEMTDYVKVEGKKVNISTRKYCLDCVPLNSGKSRILELSFKYNYDPCLYKMCTRCGNIKELNDENFFPNKKGAFVSHCKICLTEFSMDSRIGLKTKAVNYKGGKCCQCGYDKCINALEFHHLDPLKKDFSISRSPSISFDKIKLELDKCILVCANCHREIHYEINKTTEYKRKRAGLNLSRISWPNIEELRELGKTMTALEIADFLKVSNASVYKKFRKDGIEYIDRSKSLKKTPEKIKWPSDDDLAILVMEKPMKYVAGDLGISPTTLKKRCVSRNIKTPTRGHWKGQKKIFQ